MNNNRRRERRGGQSEHHDQRSDTASTFWRLLGRGEAFLASRALPEASDDRLDGRRTEHGRVAVTAHRAGHPGPTLPSSLLGFHSTGTPPTRSSIRSRCSLAFFNSRTTGFPPSIPKRADRSRPPNPPRL